MICARRRAAFLLTPRDTEVQRYLRQLEQQALPTTAHPIEVRHELAATLWRVARGLPE